MTLRPPHVLALLLVACSLAASAPVGYTLELASGHSAGELDAGSPGFDALGNTYVRSGTRLTVLRRNGRTRELDLDAIAKAAIGRDLIAGGAVWDGAWDKSFMVDTAVVGDDGGAIYTLIVPRYSNLKTAVLLWSDDGARNWHAAALTGRNAAIEKPDGFNDRSGPPSVLSFETYGGITGTRAWLDVFRRSGDAVVRAAPVVQVTDRSLLAGNHSGAANSTFTTRDRVFVAYDTTDRAGPGTLSVARAFDRASGRFVGGEVPIGRSTTEATADAHDIPAITMGPDGRLIAVIGAHHGHFLMFRSRLPGSVADGWVADGPIDAGESDGATYSYVGLAMSRRGTINIVARSEDRQARYSVVQLRKRWMGPWTVWPNGSVRREIARPDRLGYAAWRQRLTSDPGGGLYLNFRYYPNMLTDDEAARLGVAGKPRKDCARGRCWYDDVPETGAVTLVSRDDGGTWR